MTEQILLAIPILLAVLIALSKIIDHYHHWYDVLVGALIGTFFAIISYRMCYAAVWDWRYNHIPLPYCYKGDPRLSSAQSPVAMTRKLTAINMAGWENKHTKKENYEADAEKKGKEGVNAGSEKEVEEEERDLRQGNRDQEVQSRFDGADSAPPSSIAASVARFDGVEEQRRMRLGMTGIPQVDGADEPGKFKVKMRRFDMTNFLV